MTAQVSHLQQLNSNKKQSSTTRVVMRDVELFIMGFSLLSLLEFLNRETETCETKNHLLCGWRQIVIQKSPFCQ